MRPRLLDLFCGARGGGLMSYRRTNDDPSLEVRDPNARASRAGDLAMLANSLSLRQARDVISLLLSLDDPARRWTLEAIAIVRGVPMSYRRRIDASGQEVERSTAGATGDGDLGD